MWKYVSTTNISRTLRLSQLLFDYGWLYMRFNLSRSLKVTDLHKSEAHIWLLLVINCSSNLHHFLDILSHPSVTPPPSNFQIKLTMPTVESLCYFFSENCVILSSIVLSQYTRVTDDIRRQTSDYVWLWQYPNFVCNCDIWLKRLHIGKVLSCLTY